MSLERYISRHDLGWPATRADASNTNLGMVAHYDSENQRVYETDHVTPRPHSACVAYWKHCRNEHINGNGWLDVGYAYMVCPHDWILAGREYGHQQAAELPTRGKLQDGNSRYVAVTFATGPAEHPNAAQLSAWHRLRSYLRASHSMHAVVHGHRDFTSTDCPGNIIYRLVQDGTLSGDSTTEPAQQEIDLVASFPILSKGSHGFDVLTVRALLFERYLAERFENSLDPALLFTWLRNQEFDTSLDTDIRDYQRWAGLVVDGVVGKNTMSKLLRIG